MGHASGAPPSPAALLADVLARRGLSSPLPADADAVLAAALHAARAAHPSVDVPADVFVAWIAERLPEDAPVAESLASLRAADLWLACAAARGDAAAIARFDEAHAGDLRVALAKMRPPKPELAELQQVLREKLFAGPRPKIADYAGQGDLRSWVRVTALRTLVDMTRKRSGGEPLAFDAEPREVVAPGGDPELEYLKRLYAREMREAFEEAAASLSPDERNVLREHYTHGLTALQIAQIHGVHRASAARRVAAARDALLAKTRQLLMTRLRLSRAELESVVRLIESRMHVTLERVLGDGQR